MNSISKPKAARANLFALASLLSPPVLLVGGLLTGLLIVHCTPTQSRTAKTVIDVVTAACVIAHADLPNATVMQVCGIEQSLAPAVDQLLAAQKQAVAARSCPAPTPAPPASAKPL